MVLSYPFTSLSLSAFVCKMGKQYLSHETVVENLKKSHSPAQTPFGPQKSTQINRGAVSMGRGACGARRHPERIAWSLVVQNLEEREGADLSGPRGMRESFSLFSCTFFQLGLGQTGCIHKGAREHQFSPDCYFEFKIKQGRSLLCPRWQQSGVHFPLCPVGSSRQI